ncbi:MAG: hypothetical protein JXA71_03610 [Chitinispirillaceae bacterium]|nr:hypothetical protein [Chitinispirillaceae bacterium]
MLMYHRLVLIVNKLISLYVTKLHCSRIAQILVRKLCTLHVRKDRFCEGHLAGIVEAGHMTEILKRLKELRGE